MGSETLIVQIQSRGPAGSILKRHRPSYVFHESVSFSSLWSSKTVLVPELSLPFTQFLTCPVPMPCQSLLRLFKALSVSLPIYSAFTSLISSQRDHVLHFYFCIRPVFLSSHIHFLISPMSCFFFHSIASVCILSQTSLFFLKISVHCVTRLSITWDPQHLPQLFGIWRNTIKLSDYPQCMHDLCAFLLSAQTIFFASHAVLG